MIKKIGIIGLSFGTGEEYVELIKEKTQKLNFDFKLVGNMTKKYLDYTDYPINKANYLHECFTDSSIDYIISLRGGWGIIQCIHHIDLSLIDRNFKPLLGYSDTTILLNYIFQKTGKITYHGPNILQDLSNDEKSSIQSMQLALNGDDLRYKFEKKDVFKKGVSCGVIVGGNVALLVRSLGTLYEIDTKDKIIFIEAVNKKGYLLYDMLYQLKLAGKFDTCKGVILGTFRNCVGHKKYLKEFFKDFNIPVIFNQKFGHGRVNYTIPIGGLCTLDTEKLIWHIKQS